MKIHSATLISICIACLFSCSQQKTIELPLTKQDGYGYFHSNLGGISPYSEDENNPWSKTYLSATGVPTNWTEIKYGDIETNIYQTVYQNYLVGNITQEWYEKLQKSWDWTPDTLALSKEPLKTKIAFAFGKDSAGVTNMIVDANNNLDFSDDHSFVPYNFSPSDNENKDSITKNNSIVVSIEQLIDHKKQLVTVPLFIAYMSQYDMFMCNFPQHLVTTFKGEKIAVCSDRFTNLMYKNVSIALLNDTLKPGEKINPEFIIEKNEFIEIKGELYKNIGVNTTKNTLILEKMTSPKSELYSTQTGFRPFAFEGNDFTTATNISLENLKGKYVLLDFWAIWCGPCRQEIPNLKELYGKTDRNKFEIIGIVGDSPSDELKNIIEKDTIIWPQIISTETNKIKETYGVHGYPTTFLINPEGIIVAKDLRGKELEDKILSLTQP